jgi:hypothetical protein
LITAFAERHEGAVPVFVRGPDTLIPGLVTCGARINRRAPTFTTRNEPLSISRKMAVLFGPVISQNSAIVYVTRVSSTMRFSRGRRGLGSIDARRVGHFRSFEGATTAPLRG